MFPPAIKIKRSEPLMTKRVAELRQAGLEACHYIEEFYLRWIRPLSCRRKLVFECLRLADPHCEPSKGYPFDFSLYY
jgi:hypothetical protein